jgi:NADH-quinone oxidoreductase subunit H
MIFDIAVKMVLASVVLFAVLNFAGLHAWLERKQSAVMQDRIGANRAAIFGHTFFGLFHPLADALKMFTKEDHVPEGADRGLHTLAPFIAMFFGLVAFAAVPFGDVLRIAGREISLQVADINVGLLYVLAMMSMIVYGVVLAGFASNNNYSLLGGLRATSQMLSYEIAMGVSLIGLVAVYGTVDLAEMVRRQGGFLFGFLPAWGFFLQPLAFFIFVTAGIASSKRIPFDIPEGESEIIGYFLEYSGMKFGMFMFADFVETVLIASLTTVLFFGGWQIPWVPGDAPYSVWLALARIGAFTVKVCFFCWLFMTIRWTLPRFRYDQLMRLGWKGMLPLALANILVTAFVMLICR